MSKWKHIPAREVVETDFVTHGVWSGTVTKVDRTSVPGVVYIWLLPRGPVADLVLNHGDPIRVVRYESDPLVAALVWEGDQA